MPSDKRTLIEKIQALPAERIAEIEDFVDFLAGKTRRLEAVDRLLTVAPALEAAGAPRLTEEEIDAEVRAVRVAQPMDQRRGHASIGKPAHGPPTQR